ncbi:hypothetical protein THRCLA_05641, partial [Thraustotheca clavata]
PNKAAYKDATLISCAINCVLGSKSIITGVTGALMGTNVRCLAVSALLMFFTCIKAYQFASPQAQEWLGNISFPTAPAYINDFAFKHQLVVELKLTTTRVELELHDGSYVHFTTRAFNGRIPCPTLWLTPGDHLIFRIINTLAPGESNRTSIHLHGLHVGNDGIIVQPGEKKTFKFTIPKDHPSGTFWYHPHVHGLINSQISGLMAGALVILDRREDLPAFLHRIHDIPLLVQAVCASDCLHKHDMLDQAIQLPSIDREKKFKVDLYSNSLGVQVLLNAHSVPTIEIPSGEWTRLRFINAIANNIIEIAPPSKPCTTLLIAKDGIMLTSWFTIENAIILVPGGRVDVLVQCPAMDEPVPIHAVKNASAMELGHHHRIHPQLIAYLNTTANFGESITKVIPQPLQVTLPTYMRVPPTAALKTMECTYNYTFTANDSAMTAYGVNGKPFNSSSDPIKFGLWVPQLWCIGLARPEHHNHPFHIHNTHFLVLHSNGMYEWQDTIPILHEVKRIWFIPSVVGPTMSHCHIAWHADQGMAQILLVRGKHSDRPSLIDHMSQR